MVLMIHHLIVLACPVITNIFSLTQLEETSKSCRKTQIILQCNTYQKHLFLAALQITSGDTGQKSTGKLHPPWQQCFFLYIFSSGTCNWEKYHFKNKLF